VNRRRLSDILQADDRSVLADAWNRTEAAEDFAPLPSGEYIAHVIVGEPTESRTGTPAYKLTFRVAEGEHVGRRFWHDVWLTEAAMPMAKRDLGKLGITSLEQLDGPLPPGIRCRVKLALRRNDDGAEYNRVRRFDVVGIDEPKQDPFAPSDDGGRTDADRDDGSGGTGPAESSTPEGPDGDTAEGGGRVPF